MSRRVASDVLDAVTCEVAGAGASPCLPAWDVLAGSGLSQAQAQSHSSPAHCSLAQRRFGSPTASLYVSPARPCQPERQPQRCVPLSNLLFSTRYFSRKLAFNCRLTLRHHFQHHLQVSIRSRYHGPILPINIMRANAGVINGSSTFHCRSPRASYALALAQLSIYLGAIMATLSIAS